MMINIPDTLNFYQFVYKNNTATKVYQETKIHNSPGLKGAVPNGSRLAAAGSDVIGAPCPDWLLWAPVEVECACAVELEEMVSASRSGFDMTRSSRDFMHVIPMSILNF